MLQLLTALGMAAQIASATPASPELRREDLMAALRAGGYTIVLRHARTDRTIQETPGTVPATRAEQRNLSAEGVRDAKLMGEVFRKFAIPVGEIITSPMYRTRETAEFAVGTPTATTMVLRTFPTTTETGALIAAAPAPGTNRVLVTHHFVIELHVPGIRPGDIAESEAVVVRPLGGGQVALVGRISLNDWEALAGATLTTTAGPAVPAPAGPAVADVAMPATRAGQLASGYLAAFNSGDMAQMEAFIEASLVAVPGRPTAARVQAYLQTHADHGTITVTGIQASTEDEIRLQVRTRRGNFFLVVTTAPDQPGRARSISLGATGGGHG